MKKRMLTKEELAVLSRQLALVFSSDVSLQEGIDLILEHEAAPGTEALLRDIKRSIQDGRTFGQAMEAKKGIIPDFYINMMKVGEESGNLQKVLLRTAESYEKDIKTAKKVRAAVVYPVVLSLLMLGVIILLVTTVMPMFRDILVSLGSSIPPFTQAIVSAAVYIGSNILFILGIILIVLLAADIIRNTVKGRRFFDGLKLKMPVQKDIITSIAAFRLSRNMAMLIKSGISVSGSMLMLKDVTGNSCLADSIQKAASMLSEGRTLREALTEIRLFPALLVKLLAVAESTGHTEEMFDKSADIMEEELDDRLNRLTTILEPFLIIILSLILGVILLSVVFPVIGIMNAIG